MEDDKAAARLLQRELGRNGFAVDLAENGDVGLRMCEETEYDVLIVDQKMPVYDGLYVINELMQWAESPPVIMLTGGGNEAVAVEAMKLGADDYIVKDLSGGHLKLLPAVIERVLQNRTMAAERRELEAQVQHAQKLESLGVLAGGIAHDFNNLLMGILGNADLAMMEMPENAPVRQRIHGIKQAARRAADLCDQLLGYSGKGQFVIEEINLNDLIQDMVHLLEVSISKKAALRFHLMESPPAIEGDVPQMRQVVMNLITNASDALEEREGAISISTRVVHMTQAALSKGYACEDPRDGDFLCLEVEDSGVGMDDETRKRIFDPFFTTKFTGRGLGLAAVLGIIRGHGGAVRVESEKNRGTTFSVLFPCQDVARPAPVRSDEDPARDPAGGSGHVLVVDDEEMVCRITRTMLEKSGYSVVTACCGREGLRVFSEDPAAFQAVILDMTMPDMNGEEVFVEMKKLDTNARIIIASGYAESDARDHFKSIKPEAFLHKPFERAALCRAVEQVAGCPLG
jgi:signal transduction histidine kinase